MIYCQIYIRSTPIYIVNTLPYIFTTKFDIRFVFYVTSLRDINIIIKFLKLNG